MISMELGISSFISICIVGIDIETTRYDHVLSFITSLLAMTCTLMHTRERATSL